MNNMLLTGLSVLAFAATGICTRQFQLRFQKDKSDITLYQALFCFIASMCFLFQLTGNRTVLFSTLTFGIAFGTFFSLAVLYGAKCYESGPMSLTGIITNMSMVIPLLYSCVMYKESMTILQAIGVVLMLITMGLAGIGRSDKQNKASAKWLIFVVVAFLANGLTAVIQKQYGVSYPDGQRNMFMSIAYFTSAIIFILYYISRRVTNKKGTVVTAAAGWIPLMGFSLISGVSSFGGNGILTYLSTRMDASVLYPCLNGGLCIVLAASSFLFFKEKISKNKIYAIATGLAGIIILNL